MRGIKKKILVSITTMGLVILFLMASLSVSNGNALHQSLHLIFGQAAYDGTFPADGAFVTVKNERTSEELYDTVGSSGNSGNPGWFLVNLADLSMGYQDKDTISVTIYGTDIYSLWAGINTTTVDNTTTAQLVNVTLTYDPLPPVTVKQVGEPKYGEYDEYVTSTSEISLTATDTLTGVNHTYYRVWYNGDWDPLPGTGEGISNNFKLYTGAFTLTGECTHYLEFYSTDNADNNEAVQNQTHYVDETSPISTHTLDPVSPTGLNGWYNETLTVTLAATDGKSGVQSISYKYGTGAYQTYIEPLTPPDGDHVLYYYSIDNLENIELPAKTVSFKVDTASPTVDIVSGPSGTISYFDVTFVWSGSDNIGGVEYQYKLDGVWSGWTSDTSHEFTGLTEDTYKFSVKVRDGAGNTAIAERDFTISLNVKPVADAGGPYAGSVGVPVVFDGSGSYDSDGNIVSYTWNFGDGHTGMGVKPSHTYSGQGTFTVTLTVEDNYGAEDTDTATATISPNQPPTADFTYTPSDPTELDTISFIDSSSDADGSVVSWYWEFGDGTISTSQNPLYKYTDAGTYMVNLTVWDDKGDIDTLQKIIVVNTASLPAFVYVDDDFDDSTSGWDYTHFNSIQDGINAVTEGGTVFVNTGTYSGSIDINKTINLVGENAEVTIIDGLNDVVEITVDWVNFSGFTVNGHYGGIADSNIKVGWDVDYVTIKDCVLVGNGRGINLYGAFHCTVFNNTIQGAYDALIKCYGADDNVIKYNTFNGCQVPILLHGDSSNGFSNNNLIYCNNFMSEAGDPMDWSSELNINHWDNGSVGNYWYYYSETDVNNDRIGDSPYSRGFQWIFTDRYPLMYPWGEIPPIAYFEFTPSSPYQGEDEVSFSCSFRDLDGYVASYSWDFGDTVTSTDINPTHTYSEAGGYMPQLTVIDNGGMSYTASTTLHVLNHLPNANFAYTPESPRTSDVLSFTDQSTDTDGSIISRYWSFDDGFMSVAKNPIHRFTDDGFYHVSLTITDDDGGTSLITKQITIQNIPPSASFSYQPSAPLKSEIINFSDNSTDFDGTVVSWTWTFADGNVSYAQNPQHSYTQKGNYTVVLTVVDDDGATNITVMGIMVTNSPPVANFTHSPLNLTTDETINFIDKSIDIDGAIVKWTWDFGDGTIRYIQNPPHKYEEKGTYNITLIVEDDDGDTDSYSVSVTVEKEKDGGIAGFEMIVLIGAIAIVFLLTKKRKIHK